MTLSDYVRVIRERWLLIAIGTCLGAALGLVVFLVRPPEYAAQTSLYVSSQASADPQQAYLGAQLSQQRVKSYVELATGERVLDDTISRLQLPMSTEDLASRVSASSALDSVVITIAARAESPQLAAQVANTIGESTIQVVNELERPGSPEIPQPVVVRTVRPADVPDGPATPGLLLNLALGLVVGLVLATLAAIARSRFDTSIRSGAVASEVGGGPLLGSVPYDPRVERSPLIVREHPQSPCAEAFRQVRTNLQFLDVDTARKVLVVCSAIPEEGKSTTVANLGLTLSQAGHRVLIVEADLRRPRLSGLLGLDRSVGLTTVLAGSTTLSHAVQNWSGGLLDVLASGRTPPNPSELLSSNQMRSVLDECRGRYDYVLIDAPPLLPVTDAAALAPLTDGAILVCQWKRARRAQVTSARAALASVSQSPLGVVLTMSQESDRQAGTYQRYYGETEPAQSPNWKDVRPIVRNDVVSHDTDVQRTSRIVLPTSSPRDTSGGR